MTEPLDQQPNQEPAPGPASDEPAGRDFGATITAIAEDISERVTVLVDKATPVVRDAAARASELVAKAGEAAGPAAHRAAEATESLGVKVAAKGREVAADLRRSSHPADEAPTNGVHAAPDVPAAEGPAAEGPAAEAQAPEAQAAEDPTQPPAGDSPAI